MAIVFNHIGVQNMNGDANVLSKNNKLIAELAKS